MTERNHHETRQVWVWLVLMGSDRGARVCFLVGAWQPISDEIMGGRENAGKCIIISATARS
jgi:hypothetical protein